MRTYVRNVPVNEYEMKFGRADERKAARDYDCDFCSDKIKAGERYINTFVVTWNGSAFTFRGHAPSWKCWYDNAGNIKAD